jgi:hypothetical protein
MDERVRLSELNGHRLMITDARALLPREAEQVFQHAHLTAVAQPRDGTLLSLVLVKGMRFDSGLLDKLKEIGRAGAPYVRATAFAGMSALGRVVFRAVAPLTGRRISAFDTEDEARQWLLEQVAKAA